METHDIGEQGSNARLNVLSDICAVTLAIFPPQAVLDATYTFKHFKRVLY